ncbi:Hypothetical predicted protein [Cloeon dipterum]|uniref:Uncharacterized protein n=1 Tax=Cloeon dipterum TaxID=197152 RepID=A0A8S1D5P1_9INSE|nr:Hypothetical predicted protein [Cloeon dipterum]
MDSSFQCERVECRPQTYHSSSHAGCVVFPSKLPGAPPENWDELKSRNIVSQNNKSVTAAATSNRPAARVSEVDAPDAPPR